MPDLVIVGGGPAGIATAYFLRDLDLDVSILEAGPDIGGRTRTVMVGGLPSNTGALFVYRATLAEQLAAELGVRTVTFTPDTYGIHVNDETVVDTDNDRLIDRLPIRARAREQLRGFVATSLREYARYTRAGRITDEAGEIAGTTLADRLRGLDREVVEIIGAAVRGGSVADPRKLSAKYALRYFASYLAHEGRNRLYPMDGMQAIPMAMADRLPSGTVRTRRRVTGVRHDPVADRYLLSVDGDPDPIAAREVVLAVPAPVAAQIVAELPGWKREALAAVRMPGSTTLCATVDVTGLPDIARWSFIAVTGRVFDAVINPRPLSAGQADPTVAQFVCYSTTAGYRPDLSADPAAVEAWTEDFLGVAPALRGRVLGVHLQTWQHCFAILTPQRAEALPQLQRSVGRLHFAGDHTSATAGTHGAYSEARRVAEFIRGSNRRSAREE